MSTTVLVSTSTRWQQRPAKETGRRHSCPRDHITDAAEIDARGPTDKPDRLVGDSGGRLAVELLAQYEQRASIRAMVEPTGHSYGFIRDLLQAPRTHPLSKPVLEEHADRCDLTVDHASKRGLPATPQQLGSCRSSQWWR